MRPDADDVDPLPSQTVPEFALCLRRLRTRAGNPSLRTLERWGERHRAPLPRSTLADALAGQRLPRKAIVLAFVKACGVDIANDRRWEFAWNRLSDDLRNRPPASALLAGRLSEDVHTAGLLRVGVDYFNELEWEQLFASVQELDVITGPDHRWWHRHGDRIAGLAARRTARMRVVLPDPDDELTVPVLARQLDATADEVRNRIEEMRTAYQAIRHPGGASIHIRYYSGSRLLNLRFLRFDDVAVIDLHDRRPPQLVPAPALVCARPGGLFDFVDQEVRTILDHSRPA